MGTFGAIEHDAALGVVGEVFEQVLAAVVDDVGGVVANFMKLVFDGAEGLFEAAVFGAFEQFYCVAALQLQKRADVVLFRHNQRRK